MTVTDGVARPGIAADASRIPPNYQVLSRRIVDGLDLAALGEPMRSDVGVRGDLVTVVRCALEAIVIAAQTGTAVPERTAERLAAIASRWADRHLPIDVIQHAVHAAAEAVTDQVVGGAERACAASGLPAAGAVLIESLRTLSTSVARGYATEVRAMSGDQRAASQTLVSALLTGRADSVLVRRRGIELARTYLVVAMALGAHPDEHDPLLDGGVVARRKLRRVQAELARERGPGVLSLLSVDGGTVLVAEPPQELVGEPSEDAAPGSSETRLAELIDRLGRAAAAPVTATFVAATPERIPDAAERAHRLLDLALGLGRGPGLHRFRQLACEYQLVQPGPANRQLRSLLDPLQAEPELLDTVDAFFAAQCKRESAARILGISASAVRRRLDRIASLTGLDPDAPADLWYLRASFIARLVDSARVGRRAGAV
ncbi:CdaR family transcriptional regulator [Nocardia sp. BMG51109]|uniref:PucR family transcriptional regulator n=1 Tax=Nocardia sp. BMG51109 TaxID=1056816 RepID=UPI000465861B|nr:helix-turn-helix domain-containing protein [Nocardia sp. BMG51109]